MPLESAAGSSGERERSRLVGRADDCSAEDAWMARWLAEELRALPGGYALSERSGGRIVASVALKLQEHYGGAAAFFGGAEERRKRAKHSHDDGRGRSRRPEDATRVVLAEPPEDRRERVLKLLSKYLERERERPRG